MKSNLSDIVSKYLFSYGNVSIPGIGTFSITDSSSGFKLENDILTPPTRMVDFSEDVTDEDGLVKYLKNDRGCSRKEAEKAISDYSKGFLNDLLNYGVANISGIGRLSKYASGEIVFDPAKEYLITSNYMLPEINLTPIDNTGVVKNIIPEKIPVVPVAATAAALAVPTVATTATFLSDTPKPKSESKPAVTKPTVNKTVTPTAAPAPKFKLDKVAEPAPKTTPVVKKEPVVSKPIKQTPPPVVYEEERSFLSEWKWPILIGLIMFLGLVLIIRTCNKYTSGEDISISNPLASKATDDKIKEKSAESLEAYLADKPKLQKYAQYLTKQIVDEGCVVVVGSYKKSRNVIRMKDKLMRAGLDPYTETYQGMTRVGVIFPCKDHDLVEYITTLRKSFDRRAWYLSPRMDVPYK